MSTPLTGIRRPTLVAALVSLALLVPVAGCQRKAGDMPTPTTSPSMGNSPSSAASAASQ